MLDHQDPEKVPEFAFETRGRIVERRQGREARLKAIQTRRCVHKPVLCAMSEYVVCEKRSSRSPAIVGEHHDQLGALILTHEITELLDPAWRHRAVHLVLPNYGELLDLGRAIGERAHQRVEAAHGSSVSAER
jgi:hypothetical protein